MRRRFSRKVRKNILREGGILLQEGWIAEPGWRRKDIGFGAQISYLGWTLYVSGDDELACYRIALASMEWVRADLGERKVQIDE